MSKSGTKPGAPGGQYEASPEREYGKSGYGHNTVTVDGLAQLRLEPKMADCAIDAKWETNDVFDYACGIYEDTFGDGLRPAVHKREVRFCKPSLFIVRDTLTSLDNREHVYGLRFHMDTVRTEELAGGAIHADYGRKWDLLVIPIKTNDSDTEGFRAFSGQKEPCLLGWYIGRNEARNHPATTIVMDSRPCLEHQFTTVFIPYLHGSPLPEFQITPDNILEVAVGKEIYRTELDRLNR